VKLGSLEFGKRPVKQFHAPEKPFMIPDDYDNNSI
jgi:hypothetical protein